MSLITNLLDACRTGFNRQGFTHDGLRDLWGIFGYPDKLTIKDYREKYKRGDIASRIVDAYPNGCWSNPPICCEDEQEQELTEWEQSVDNLFTELNFWQVIRKLDKLVNLGNYAVLYLGFIDGSDLKLPVSKGAKLAYLKPLAEDVATIKTYVDEPSDKRFGMPLLYELTLKSGVKREVHWSRVIHVAERTLDDECSGGSILEPIWNKLIDLEKVAGGAAEIFWLNARGGMALEADVDADLGSDDDKKALKEEVEAYQHNLRRVIRTKGFKITPIVQKVESPKDQFDIIISLIAGTVSIPKRILLGNEAGELASSQDENNWNSKISDRQKNFCESHMLNKFLDYMIELGIIKPLGKDKKYEWEWPSLTNISDKDKAEIGNKKASSLVAYSNSLTADTIIPPKQFVEDILGMEYREDEIAQMIADENTAIDKSLANYPNNQDNTSNPVAK